MGGQAVFILPAGDGGSDHGGAVPVADIVLNDKYRPDSPLLRPNHRAEICVKHFTSCLLYTSIGADTADSIAAKTGTINYEIICGISRRVPRVYLRDGAPVRIWNDLEET